MPLPLPLHFYNFIIVWFAIFGRLEASLSMFLSLINFILGTKFLRLQWRFELVLLSLTRNVFVSQVSIWNCVYFWRCSYCEWSCFCFLPPAPSLFWPLLLCVFFPTSNTPFTLVMVTRLGPAFSAKSSQAKSSQVNCVVYALAHN